MAETALTTPLPTNQTLQGPRVAHDKATLVVEYDYEGDGNAAQWAAIIFTEPLFYRFTDISCCDEADIVSANEIRRQDESELLAAVISRWNEAVGWQEWQQKGGSSRFAHFTVFFDDAGALDVVASGCDVARR